MFYVKLAIWGMSMPAKGPVELEEGMEGNGRFLVYADGKGLRIEIRYEGESLWMTQMQIAELFGRDPSVVSRHIANIFSEGELEPDTNMQKMHLSPGRPIALYSLDTVISVGYRVSSKQATLFRRWATETLVQFATKGFVVDAARLKRADEHDRVSELRDIIRDIRSDEANVYRELRKICAMCQDYDGTTQLARNFYTQIQAKIVWAVTSHTPAEIIRDRANAKLLNMGLTNWPNENIRKNDVSTSKNFLAAGEVKELNRLTTILLDIFEDQAELGKLVTMSQATTLLDLQLRNLNRSILNHGGQVTAESAKSYAESEYAKFKLRVASQRRLEADEKIRALKQLKEEARLLPKRTKS